MTAQKATDVLTFSDVWKCLHPDRDLVGPLAPVADHRMVAGLLFRHYNDNTTRVLENFPGLPPKVEVTWQKELSLPRSNTVYVTQDAVATLLKDQYIEGTPEWGSTDMYHLRLSDRGMRKVITEWISGGDFHDAMMAGASLDLRSGEVNWRR